MTQRAITVLASLSEQMRPVVASRIESIGHDPDLDAPDLHYLSSSVIDDKADPNQIQSYVLLEMNVDGGTRAFLKHFAADNPAFLDELFTDCEDYNREDRYRFLIRNSRPHFTYHRGTPGRTVQQIQCEQELLAQVRNLAAQLRPHHPARADLWCDIRENLNDEQLSFVKAAPRRPKRVYWNLFRPAVRTWLGLFLTQFAKALLYLIGLTLAARYAREFWQLALVVGLPVLVMLTRVVLDLQESPHHLKVRPRLSVFFRILGRSISGGLAVAALMGLIVGAKSLGWAAMWPGIAWGLVALLAVVTILVLLLLGYLSAGWPGFWTGLVIAGTSVSYSAIAAGGHNIPLLSSLQILGLTVFAVLVVGLVVLQHIRALEALDEVTDEDVPIDHLRKIMQKESNPGKQKHLTSVTAIKTDWPRLWVLKIVLRTIHLGSYFVYNEGFLAGISSIHLARFVILPGNRSLLFLSNYDGSFDGYLSEFKRSEGVTAVWGNTIGFPRSFLLLFDGAKDEHRFKRYARNSQVPTQVWYQAYPLLVGQIDNASQIRRNLNREVVNGTHGYWISWKNLITRRMSESDLADSLRRIG